MISFTESAQAAKRFLRIESLAQRTTYAYDAADRTITLVGRTRRFVLE